MTSTGPERQLLRLDAELAAYAADRENLSLHERVVAVAGDAWRGLNPGSELLYKIVAREHQPGPIDVGRGIFAGSRNCHADCSALAEGPWPCHAYEDAAALLGLDITRGPRYPED